MNKSKRGLALEHTEYNHRLPHRRLSTAFVRHTPLYAHLHFLAGTAVFHHNVGERRQCHRVTTRFLLPLSHVVVEYGDALQGPGWGLVGAMGPLPAPMRGALKVERFHMQRAVAPFHYNYLT